MTEAPAILCIEDEPDLREDLVLELSGTGHRVAGVGDGRAGLDMIRKGGVRLVFCDVQLPGMSGLDLLEALGREPGGAAAPPVVLLTAFGDTQLRQRAQALGACNVLVKPVDYDAVIALADSLLGEAP